MNRPATPVGSQARKLVAATLALVACRVVSQWNSLAAGFAALMVVLALAANLIAGMPRFRRVLLMAALPVSTLANALAFGLGSFVTLLGTQGLLANGQILSQGPPWNVAFVLVPLAAATNLVWLARPISRPFWLGYVWLVNLGLAGYAAWCWHADNGFSGIAGLPLPLVPTLLISLAIVSMITLAWDTRARASSGSACPRLGRRVFVSASALLVFAAISSALFPAYGKRQAARSLETFGLHANFGIIFPGWKSPIELPWGCKDYLGEINGAAAAEAFKGDVGEAGRLLNSLPWLNTVIVNELPVQAERLLQPLAGQSKLRQICLKGAGVTDETLADAAQIPGLNWAVFERAAITDAGLAHLAGSQWLQVLMIRRTPISGEGLAHLRSLPRLSELNLSGTDVGDRQLSELRRFKALVELSLENTRVTDEGLSVLAQCKTLKVIKLGGTSVTQSGVEQLRRALPNCRVAWQPAAEE